MNITFLNRLLSSVSIAKTFLVSLPRARAQFGQCKSGQCAAIGNRAYRSGCGARHRTQGFVVLLQRPVVQQLLIKSNYLEEQLNNANNQSC